MGCSVNCSSISEFFKYRFKCYVVEKKDLDYVCIYFGICYCFVCFFVFFIRV